VTSAGLIPTRHSHLSEPRHDPATGPQPSIPPKILTRQELRLVLADSESAGRRSKQGHVNLNPVPPRRVLWPPRQRDRASASGPTCERRDHGPTADSEGRSGKEARPAVGLCGGTLATLVDLIRWKVHRTSQGSRSR